MQGVTDGAGQGSLQLAHMQAVWQGREAAMGRAAPCHAIAVADQADFCHKSTSVPLDKDLERRATSILATKLPVYIVLSASDRGAKRFHSLPFPHNFTVGLSLACHQQAFHTCSILTSDSEACMHFEVQVTSMSCGSPCWP